MAIQILMPMGGLGSRFADAGYDTPKPLIEVDGKVMFLRSLDSFVQLTDVSYLFVIREEHNQQYDLKAKILGLLPSAKVAILTTDTRGAVETCLKAEKFIRPNMPLIIADCDTYFQSTSYIDAVKLKNSDGLLLTFKSNNARYSYASVDETSKVVRTAEKVVISSNAILGGYYFKSAKRFISLAHNFVDNPLPEGMKEYYLSHLFNLLIADGGTVTIANAEEKHIFGTPEELSSYLQPTPSESNVI